MGVVIVTESGGAPRVNVTDSVPQYVTELGFGVPITLVASDAPPITLLNDDGTLWEAP